MSVLAFLQNAYTRDEETALELETMFADPRITGRMQHHRKVGLFEGRNYTGLALKSVFGADVVNAIWWENASPRWGWLSHHKFPADLDHISRICQEHRSSVVLTFGKVATDAISNLKPQLESPLEFATIISGPHPASRLPDKWETLRSMNRRLLDAAQFILCPHCATLSTDGSHCDHCQGAMYEGEALRGLK